MIYVCVPVHNEARTAGLVLWKVRQVFTAFPREYQLLVCDDGSTDETAHVLASYAKVLPMILVTHPERRGYAKSLEELLGLALQRSDRPRRDCAIVLHADFSHSPDAMEEMVRRLESGTDVVVAELLGERGHPPWALRWARRWAPRLLRVPGLKDTVSGFIALRLIVWRQAQRRDGHAVLTTDGWSANAELLARVFPHARRFEAVASTTRYDLVQRPPRTNPWRKLMAAWRSRAVIRAARNTAAAALLLALPHLGQAQTDTCRRSGAPPSTPDSSVPSTPSPIRPPPSAVVPVAPSPPSPTSLPPRAAPAQVTEPTPAVAVPFPVGERLVYAARLGVFSVGEAVMEVEGLDTVRATETVHFRFHIQGGALWYHLDQTLESWVGRYDFRSRRFRNQTKEKGKSWEHLFEIFPDSGLYRERGYDSTFATVADPLDDAAFLYWIRTVPLEVGQRYEYKRYFRPERNPVIVEVLGQERINIAGRKWNAIVLRPTIPHGGGIFAEKSEARMWLSDDANRIMLALQSKFSFGVVTLKLKEYSVPEHP